MDGIEQAQPEEENEDESIRVESPTPKHAGHQNNTDSLMLGTAADIFSPEHHQRKMILLEEALSRATGLLKEISIHAEYPASVTRDAHTIASRLTSWEKPQPEPAPSPTTPPPAPTDTTILESIAKAIDRLATRLDHIEAKETTTTATPDWTETDDSATIRTTATTRTNKTNRAKKTATITTANRPAVQAV
ncbi:hypothetical protein EVJ58_g6095, partial [Rhodofomes roseus]